MSSRFANAAVAVKVARWLGPSDMLNSFVFPRHLEIMTCDPKASTRQRENSGLGMEAINHHMQTLARKQRLLRQARGSLGCIAVGPHSDTVSSDN